MSELNLIPYELKKKKQSDIKLKDFLLYVLILGVLLGFGILFPMLRYYSLGAQEKSLKTQIDQNKGILVETENLKTQIANIKKHTAKIDVLTKGRVTSYNVIKGIEAYIPSDVIINGLTYNKDTITINARSTSYNSICIFVANLQMSKEYRGSRISSIIGEQSKSSFIGSITIDLKEVQ